MYNVEIRQHIMIAHSLKDPAFGPAQGLHGATYIVDVIFYSETLTPQNIVIDIALAHEVLEKVLHPLKYQNLDELPQFKGILTTTEYMAAYIHGQVKEALKGEFEGPIKVRLEESHVAAASYQA